MSMHDEVRRAVDDLRFWEQIRGDAKRTIVVHPEKVERVQAAAISADVLDLVTVLGNPILDLDQAFVIDIPAMEAYERQGSQTLWRDLP